MAYFNYPLIHESKKMKVYWPIVKINEINLILVRRVKDDIVNYLQLVFEYNSQVYAFTFSENGDELTDKGKFSFSCK